MIVLDEQVQEELARYGQTTGGRMVRAKLAALIMDVAPMGMKSGALREFIGSQRLARELVNSLDAYGPPGRPTDEPDVTFSRGASAEPAPRGSRRRVTASGPGTRNSSRG